MPQSRPDTRRSPHAERTPDDRTPDRRTEPVPGPVPRAEGPSRKAPSVRNRSALTHRVRYALRHPGRVLPHLRRLVRDWKLRRATGGDHVAYYRAVMRSDTARNPNAAVGTPSEERWNALGEMQFTYLRSHGLLPSHRLLEIGCGNLRAGRHFIDHLDTGHYYGIDISPDILLAAQRTLTEHALQAKLPHLTLVGDLRLAHLPDHAFDVVHAHSVFSHSPLHVIDECFRHVARVMAPGGFFDFTYNRTDGPEHHVLHEDFYYRPSTLIRLAESRGLSARLMDDWDALPHKQSKIRITVPESS
ncbi:class I SAM-dependent methyltransferase [Streptomyces sp. HNM0574]|uniref:class I SAM-dependent DNA methyltransferase n=1 Tax=Streptomyces sp. HNM0574 TaxID=2714954 RepID=UPI00146CDDD2|nr:class I SAM-dependent methyltransferase [Streptomyces sp. HNM0574]NLU67527.1 class I SAM-dependent methyltransferase [Streptomyces sp. HNM0574]